MISNTRVQRLKKPKRRRVSACEEPCLPYSAWHEDAERREKAGQRQKYCTVCKRYQWPDLVCAAAQLVEERPVDNSPDVFDPYGYLSTHLDTEYWD